jgi:hypothetical protein
MQYRSKPAHPKAGDTLTLVSLHKAVVKEGRQTERKTLSIGRYVGNGSQLTAFVMLDPEDVLQVQAANE